MQKLDERERRKEAKEQARLALNDPEIGLNSPETGAPDPPTGAEKAGNDEPELITESELSSGPSDIDTRFRAVLTDPEYDLDPTHESFSLIKGRSHVHQKKYVALKRFMDKAAAKSRRVHGEELYARARREEKEEQEIEQVRAVVFVESSFFSFFFSYVFRLLFAGWGWGLAVASFELWGFCGCGKGVGVMNRKQCRGNSVVETVLWKRCCGNRVVETVWWKQCGGDEACGWCRWMGQCRGW